jgi:hypothetical protein
MGVVPKVDVAVLVDGIFARSVEADSSVVAEIAFATVVGQGFGVCRGGAGKRATAARVMVLRLLSYLLSWLVNHFPHHNEQPNCG